MSDKIKVTVIIPTYNRAEQLKQCLLSLRRQSFKYIEIIVVDDGSMDNVSELMNSLFPEVCVLRHKNRIGPAFSRNEAAERARGEYLWFLDSDSIVENSTCLNNMIDFLEKDPLIGCLGGEYAYSSDGEFEFRKKAVFLNGQAYTIHILNRNIYSESCDFVATSNCFIKKSIFDKLGGFDPDYFSLGEDCELGYKVKKMGMRNIVDIRTSAFHDIDLEERDCDMFRALKNRIRFVLKNFSLLQLGLLFYHEIMFVIHIRQDNKLRQGETNSLKHVPKLVRYLLKGDSYKKDIGVLCAGGLYLYYLFCAYIWNSVFLLSTLSSRLRKG